MSDQQKSWVSLSSSQLSAEINPLGAQLSALRDRDGRELLWDGNPSVWAGRAPLLFPIVGTLRGGQYRLGSKTYRLARHGFARGLVFEIVHSTATTALFRLKADEATVQVYPFRFELEVRFELNAATLSVTTSIRNAGAEEMPASFGYHPAFRWPLPYGQPRAAHFIEFADEEPAPVRRLDSDGLLTAERHATPIVNRRLVLADSLFQNDVLILDEIRSRCVSYGAADGPRLRVSYPDSPYLGLWMKPGANFICIEPWHGVSDPSGFSGDFREKPGVFGVAAGGALAAKIEVTLLGA